MHKIIKKRVIGLLLIAVLSVQSVMGESLLEKLGRMLDAGLISYISAKALMQAMGSAQKDLLTHSIEPITVKDTKLKDYAGVPEAVDKLVFQIRFPEAYSELKAPMTKGVLLTGKPGTGKTFLARAVAGETGCPFFAVSATEFQQPYAGMSGKIIRDLFKNAKLAALQSPTKTAIIFIDEIDAVGQRNAAHMGGSPVDIVQSLLTQMDGFSTISFFDLPLNLMPYYFIGLPKVSVVVFAATNTPDVLDSALKRPGRFDNIIEVGVPGELDRQQIINLHLIERQGTIADDVKLAGLVKATDGMTPADIKAIFQEAARSAAYSQRNSGVQIKDFCFAIFDMFGRQKGVHYEKKLIETLIAMYPCDSDVTLETVLPISLRYKKDEDMVRVFEDAYAKSKSQGRLLINMEDLGEIGTELDFR